MTFFFFPARPALMLPIFLIPERCRAEERVGYVCVPRSCARVSWGPTRVDSTITGISIHPEIRKEPPPPFPGRWRDIKNLKLDHLMTVAWTDSHLSVPVTWRGEVGQSGIVGHAWLTRIPTISRCEWVKVSTWRLLNRRVTWGSGHNFKAI